MLSGAGVIWARWGGRLGGGRFCFGRLLGREGEDLEKLLSKVARLLDGRPIGVKDQMLLFDFELAFSDAAVAAGVALDMLGEKGAESFIAAEAQEEIEEAVAGEAGRAIDAFAETEIGLFEEARPIDGCEDIAFAPDLEVERFFLPCSFFLFDKHPLFDVEARLRVKAGERKKGKEKETKNDAKGGGRRGKHGF